MAGELVELKPDETVHKVLISSPARFVGEFRGEDCLLTHSFPRRDNQNPRHFFVFTFSTEPIEKAPGIVIPDYSYIGDIICSYLSVLFGKRFDNHGLLEGSGFHWLPNIDTHDRIYQKSLPHNSDNIRPDFEIPLNLTELSRIKELIHGQTEDKFGTTFIACSRFYSLALINSERNPEVAYLNLITACERLSNHFDYEAEALLDPQILGLFTCVEQNCGGGNGTLKQLKAQLRSIKKKYIKTLLDLVDASFFEKSEAAHQYARLKEDSFEKAIRSAYDLRSRYVHTGSAFGSWVALNHGGGNNEVQFGSPVLQDKEFAKIIKKAPTLVGLERIVRYALLQFASRNDAFSPPWTFYNMFSHQ